MKKVNYEELSQVYDKNRSVNAKTINDLIRLTKIGSNSLLLDSGSGTGNYGIALNKIAKRVIGVDLSLKMIERTRIKEREMDLINGDIVFLPFKSLVFDGMYVIQVLHNLQEKIQFLKEARRVLKVNGHLAIHTCSHDQINAYWCYYYFPGGLKVDFKRIPDIKDIVSILDDVGFLEIRVKPCHEDMVILNQTPENYLIEDFRNADSTFALLTNEEIIRGCEHLREDIKSGVIYEIIEEYKKKIDFYGGSTIIYCHK